MFFALFRYELRQWLKQPAIYLYFFTFFSLAFIAFAGTAGFFDPPAPEDTAAPRILNAPFFIHFFLQYFNKFFLFLLPAIVGAAMFNDFKYRAHHILYSYPLKKSSYLFGKFLSALAVVISITLTAGLGIGLAEHLPGLPPRQIGPFNGLAYVQVYLVYTIPNMLFYGALVFAAVTRYRNIYAGFAAVVLVLLLQVMAENVFAGDNFLVALTDPLGQNAAADATRLWTPGEKNTLPLPVSGVVPYNRLLWAAITAAIFVFAYRQFSFSESARAPRRARARVKSRPSPRAENDWAPLRGVGGDFSPLQQAKKIWSLSRFEFRQVAKSTVFLFIGLLALATVVVTLARVTNTGEMTLLPLTRIVLAVPAFFFTVIVVLVTFLFAGMVVQRERASGMHWLTDVTPTPDWVFLLSKTLAVLKIQVLLLLLLLLAGVLLQGYNGYYQPEIGLYLFHLFVLVFPVLAIWAFAAVGVHTLVPHLYVALFLLILAWLGTSSLPEIGVTTRLLLFNPANPLPYSDLDGYGNQLAPYLLVRAYWFVFALILLLGAWLFWYRGMPQSFPERFGAARRRFVRPARLMAGGLLLAFAALGGFIFFEEQKTFAATGSKQAFKSFEEKYKRYARVAQPRIVRVAVALDLYPETNCFEARGRYTLVNTTSEKIDTLLVKTGFDEITSIETSRVAEVIEADTFVRFSVLRLHPGLLPGDSMTLDFAIQNKPNTFFERNSSVLRNGTFLRQDIFPRLGYFLNAGQKNPTDPMAGDHNYQAIDADLIDFEATVSTPADQWAIAPGTLQKTWVAGGRRYTQYKTEKIKFAFAFHAGRYAVAEARWGDVGLVVYHHPAHRHNLDRLFSGVRAALAYNTRYFGSYQHRDARIIEFPQTEGSFATAFANNLPLSELRFVARVDTAAGTIDLPFYTPAHELTHHWWGNQLMPADARGASMLTESITEYITLNIYERQYGAAQALKFLALQHERYLRGRTGEPDREPPLMLAGPEQQYLAYGKGTLAFNTMRHYLGEDSLNGILGRFLDNYRNQGPPYPTSADLVQRLKQSTPDSLRYLVTDLFETVTFCDNAIRDISVTPLAGGQYAVDISVSVRKLRGAEPGREQAMPVAGDYLEIGFYDSGGALQALKTLRVERNDSQLRVVLGQRPARVVLDPRLFMLEKDRADNARGIE